MKTIVLKNSHGETMEVQRGDDGKIRIRHSDSDPDSFGEFLDAELYLPENRSHPFSYGSIVYGKLCSLNKAEVGMIREAIKQLG